MMKGKAARLLRSILCLVLCSSAALAEPAPRLPTEQWTIDAYKKTNHAVVNVSTRAEAFDMFGPVAQEGSGSGVIVDARKGYIFTNYHVIEGASQVAVTLADNHAYAVRLVGQDPDNDLSLLQIVDPPSDLTAVEFGDSSTLQVGQRVLAIGNPFGLNRTLTEGIISSLERSIRASSGRVIQDVIQTDAAINPGNSGGPLLDLAGRLVGLNTAILSGTGQYAGIGFAVPVETLKTALPQLIEHGHVLRPKIGVIVSDSEFGPVILFVQPGSPAEDAQLNGVRRRMRSASGYVVDFSDADFILAVNGKRVANKAEVFDALSGAKEDAAIELLVRRGRGATRIVKVKPVLG